MTAGKSQAPDVVLIALCIRAMLLAARTSWLRKTAYNLLNSEPSLVRPPDHSSHSPEHGQSKPGCSLATTPMSLPRTHEAPNPAQGLYTDALAAWSGPATVSHQCLATLDLLQDSDTSRA